MAATEIWRSNVNVVSCRITEPKSSKGVNSAHIKGSTAGYNGSCECANLTVQGTAEKSSFASSGFENKWKERRTNGQKHRGRRHKFTVAEAGVEAAGETAAADASVKVTIKLYRKCHFGERFHLSGSEDFLGNWNVETSIPLDWTDGDIWSTELDVPAGVSADYKFVLVGKRGVVEWSPGPNKVLDTNAAAGPALLLRVPWDNEELPTEGEGEGEGEGEESVKKTTTGESTSVEAEEVKVSNGAVASSTPSPSPSPSPSSRRMPLEGSVLEKDAQWGLKVWESLLGSLGRKPLMEEEPQNRAKHDS